MTAKPGIHLLARFETQLLLLILLVIAPALGLFVYGHFEQQRIERERNREGAGALSNLAAANELNIVNQARQLLATLSDLSFLVLAKDSNFCHLHFSNLQKLLPDYVNFGIIETDGTLFCTGTPLKTPVTMVRDPFVKQVIETKKYAVTGQTQDLVADPAALTIGFPVLDTNRNVIRVLFAAVHRSLLSDTLGSIGLPAGASLMVMDTQGTILAQQPNPEKWVGKSIPSSQLAKEILSQTNSVFEVPGINGEPQLVALSRIQDGKTAKLFITASLPVSLSRAGIRAMLVRNLTVLGVVSAIVLLIARIYSQRFFLSPIRKVISAADRLAGGDLAARTGITKGSTELNQLGMRFDFMAQSLMHRHIEIEKQKAEITKMNADLETRVNDRTERLAFMNRELEAFSYSVSHDLRAPIRHMNGFADLLQKHNGASLDEKGARFLRMIRESSKRMGALIDDLLLFSRIGREELRHTKFSSLNLVDEVITSLRPDFDGRNIEWTIEPVPDICGDRGMFRQVWLNLIGNAIKYTKTREIAKIAIGSKIDKPGEVIFFIRDNGVGFQMQYVDKLFGVFQRLHSESEFEGTGVGLANVRRIVGRHGGRTWAEGEPEKGACFYFSVNDAEITTT
ncbi:MAG: aphA [Verrucomicrobiales bacterium]|nr:aphA [Verrucomicrobiales bacterium]